MSVSAHDDTGTGALQTHRAMIELQLTIDEGGEPVTGHVAAGHDGERTPFIGYVELISALERVRASTSAPRARDYGAEEL